MWPVIAVFMAFGGVVLFPVISFEFLLSVFPLASWTIGYLISGGGGVVSDRPAASDHEYAPPPAQQTAEPAQEEVVLDNVVWLDEFRADSDRKAG